MNSIKTADDLYKTIEVLCNEQKEWKQIPISFSRLDKFINENLDQFFSYSEEYGMKRKFESLLNLSKRVKIEFNNKLGMILAFSIQGIANEVLNEGVHIQPLLPSEIIELIVYHMLLDNFFELKNFYPKNSDLIWRKFKLNVDNAMIKILEPHNYGLSLFGIKGEAKVDFIIDHKDQILDANLGSDMSREFLEKLATHCPQLKSLRFYLFKHFEEKGISFIGNLTHLKILDINSSYAIPGLSLALEKLTSLTKLCLTPFQEAYLPAIERMTDLNSLRLNSSQNISKTNFSFVFEKFSFLTDLSLTNGACQGSELIKVIGKMTYLTYLDLSNNPNIVEVDMLESLKKLTRLQDLNLSDTPISLDKLPLAIEKMKDLENLHMTYYDPSADQVKDLITLLKKLPSLKFISTNKAMKNALKTELKNIVIHKF